MLRTCSARHIRSAPRIAFEFQSNRTLQRRTISNAHTHHIQSSPGPSSSKVTVSAKSFSTTSQAHEDAPKSVPASTAPSSVEQPSSTYVKAVKVLASLLGYQSKTSTAIRETRDAYALCANRDNEETNFIHEQCRLSPTYQTWFQIANLHVWLIRARYRALPKSHGPLYDQEIINHFFIDVEHRMRVALNHKAPERIVKGYMNEMRDQWSGATFSFDLGLVRDDTEMSGAVWRNVFASRGLDGKGEVVGKPGKTSLEPRAVQNIDSSPSVSLEDRSSSGSAATASTAGSSSAASNLALSDAALADLPFHLYIFTAYIRRELRRLEALSDEDVLAGRMGSFGSFESHVRAAERDFMMEKEERSLLGLEDDVPGARTSQSTSAGIMGGRRVAPESSPASLSPLDAGSVPQSPQGQEFQSQFQSSTQSHTISGGTGVNTAGSTSASSPTSPAPAPAAVAPRRRAASAA